MRILFVCGRARARSPTAEQIFARVPGIETASAGVSQQTGNGNPLLSRCR